MNQTQTRESVDLREIAEVFPLRGSFNAGVPYGSGHINDAFAVRFDKAGTPARCILQRINRQVFRTSRNANMFGTSWMGP